MKLSENTIIGLDAGFWERANRRLQRDLRTKDPAIVQEFGPNDKPMSKFEGATLKPMGAHTGSHGPVNYSAVEYLQRIEGGVLRHVHAYWHDRDGVRLCQSLVTTRH